MAIDVKLEIKTFFLESTSEWIGEIEYTTKDSNGTIRYARETEQAAIAAMYSELGCVFLESVDNEGIEIEF
jgi:hypothetical protein